jgi:hypothetical protein
VWWVSGSAGIASTHFALISFYYLCESFDTAPNVFFIPLLL